MNVNQFNVQSLEVWLSTDSMMLTKFAIALLVSAQALRLAQKPSRCSTRLQSNAAPAEEIERRRNLAIISHPDAGKTTLTEKLLLYGDAIQQAGMVKARANGRSSTSDFLKMERERGISISSTCLTFEYGASRVNLMDTPGHADFSEDTYRTLSAADNAVMLVDGGKGLEPQTRKLFGVAQRSRLPVFTFVNKLDRPAMSPWEVLDEIAAEFGLETAVRTWPIGDGERFRGVLDVESDQVWIYERGARGDKASVTKIDYADEAAVAAAVGDEELVAQLAEDREMIAELTPALDDELLKTGAMTAVYFGSAMSDAGVEPFLDEFISLGSRPAPRTLRARKAEDERRQLAPTGDEFAGYVFKMQANLDPKHRDCMAYVRIVSGKFTKGMKVTHARTGRPLTLATAAMLFGSGKDTIQDAFPGDIIGLNNPAGGLFQIGDALHSGAAAVAFEPIPSFSPECFGYLRPSEVGASKKSFQKGVDQLLAEGAVQRLKQRGSGDGEDPLLAAVGELQFEVVVDRMQGEYGVACAIERVSYTIARWAQPELSPEDAWAVVDRARGEGALTGVFFAEDVFQRPVLLFRNQFTVDRLENDADLDLGLKPWALPPANAP